ncbi:glycosyltransferase [Actinotalea subterranea]|uniref:glycosyltransferase n=1 Tax=Actinotalea subterranea TaxID=2607497 RepID=UPI0011EE7EC0|nr:glycosyltransferase [Actinotalea subterranea]
MTEARTQATTPDGRPPTVEVTAVVVTRGVTEYLPDTLAALAAGTRPPQRVVVVDAAHTDDAAQPGELDALVAPLRDVTHVTVTTASAARTFGHAVRTGLDQVHAPGGGWLWLLHDDSAPAPTALAQLLRAVEVAPSVAVAGCKQHTWSGPVRVLEVGLATSRFGRRMTGLEEPEVDQGQHDGRDDVLAVGVAGALVRRDVWETLGGTDPALGPYGDGLDLCRRARLAGHRVIVVPGAVVRHAQASLGLPVGGAVLNRSGWDARRSAQARREAYLHAQLVHVPLGLVPVVSLLAVVSGLVRALARFVTKEPHLVVAELAAPWRVLARPGRVVAARRRATATRRLPRRSLRPLEASWRDVVRQERDRRLTAAERRRVRQAPSELEVAELAALRTRRRVTLAAVVVAAVSLTALVVGPLVTRVLAGERLTGGSLPFGDADLGELWAAATSGWVPGGLGAAGPTDPLLLALSPLTALTGTLGGAGALVMLGALVLAALGAWFAAGAVTRSVGLRSWAALVWVAAPALLLGIDQVRLGAVLAHVMLPWVALGVARAIGVARVDAVESGLVGAQRLGVVHRSVALHESGRARAQARWDAEETGELPLPPPRDDEPDLVVDRGVLEREPHEEGADAPEPRSPQDLPLDRLPSEWLPSERVRSDRALPDAPPTEPGPVLRAVAAVRTAEPSLAAAAGAGLAFAVAVAGAPVLLPFGILALLVVAVPARRRRRLVWVALPALVLQGPMVVEAVRTWSTGGWRLLLADPGLPVASTAAPAWQQLLGWPVDAAATLDGPWTGLPDPWPLVVPLACTGVVAMLAVLALAVGAPRARGIRAAWLVAATGLAAAVAAGAVEVAIADGSTPAGDPLGPTTVLTAAWAGPGTSLALLGLLAAALAGASGVRAAMAHATFGWRQVGAAALVVVAVAGPGLLLGTWTWQARTGDGPALRTSGVAVVPAVGRQMQDGPDGARVLSLSVDANGDVEATLLRHDGVQLSELSRAVTARALTGLPGAAEALGPDAADTALAEAAAHLASGAPGEVAADLADLGVGAVLMPPVRVPSDGVLDPGPADADADAHERSLVAGRIDSTLGLERVTETESGIIWRVAAADVGTTAAWARLVGGDDGALLASVESADGAVDTDIPAGEQGRVLVLADRADGGWHATLDGRPLRSVERGWHQAFEVGPDGGRLVVTHDAAGRVPWLALQGTVVLVTVLLAVPTRRRRGGVR